MDNISFAYDSADDVVTLCGVRYRAQLFRTLGLGEPGTWLRIEQREDGLVSVFTPGAEQREIFDRITGRPAP